MKEKTDLYRHFNDNGTLLYVGISFAAISRNKNHINYCKWAAVIAQINSILYFAYPLQGWYR